MRLWGDEDEPRPDVPDGYWNSAPGDRFAEEADLTVYWPAVRPCWEAAS